MTAVRFKGLTKTTAQLESDKFAGRIGFNTTLARYVCYFDATNYATMARRDVLETFALGIQDSTLGVGLPMYATTAGRHATESVSAFRTRIGVAGAERVDRSLKSATASGWLKLATVRVTGTGGTSSFMAEVVSVGRSTGTSDTQRVRLFVRIKQNSAMSSPLDIIQCEYTSEGGSSFTLGYVIEQNDATEKRASIYVGANSSTHYMRYTVLSAYANASGVIPAFFEDPTPLASQPTPWVDASLAALAAGAGTLTTLSTTGLATLAQATVSDLTTGRMVSTTTAGRLQALDAAGSRSLIAAYGSGDNASFGTLSTTGLATLAQATVSDLTTGRVVTTTTGGRLRALNYVPLGDTTGGSTGEPRICSGVAGGALLALSGLDITDAGGFSFLQLDQAFALLGNNAPGGQVNIQAIASVVVSAPTVNVGDGSASSVANMTVRDVNKTIFSTTESVGGNIFNQYTTVTQSGIVTNQSLAGTGAGSRTIGANRLNAQGSGMEIYLCGTYTTDGSAGNATIRIRLGSTTFRTIGSFALDGNVTDGVWYIRGRITTRTTGAAGTIGGQLMWEHQASSIVGSQVMHIETATSSADVTLDLTASQVFDVDWTATDAGTSITCTCFSINLIR